MVTIERFMSHVDQTGTCWLWVGSRHRQTGYGMIWVADEIERPNGRKGQMRQAHRVAYELFVGPLGEFFVLHRCDVRACVNPQHLWLGTQADNMHDCSEKGRSPVGSRHPRALSAETVAAIRSAYATGRVTQQALATVHSVSISTISRLVNSRRHRDSWEVPDNQRR